VLDEEDLDETDLDDDEDEDVLTRLEDEEDLLFEYEEDLLEEDELADLL